jgi:hypothetical protein
MGVIYFLEGIKINIGKCKWSRCPFIAGILIIE